MTSARTCAVYTCVHASVCVCGLDVEPERRRPTKINTDSTRASAAADATRRGRGRPTGLPVGRRPPLDRRRRQAAGSPTPSPPDVRLANSSASWPPGRKRISLAQNHHILDEASLTFVAADRLPRSNRWSSAACCCMAGSLAVQLAHSTTANVHTWRSVCSCTACSVLSDRALTSGLDAPELRQPVK